MYKSKLQEYCHSKAWNLPEYSTIKEGLDHCPQFKATVTVNGSTFSTFDLCKSSKEAQNMAAKLAFEHITGSLSASSTSPVPPTSSDVQQPKTNETLHAATLSAMNSTNRDAKKFKDMAHLYKNQLQTYAQKRNLVLPVYISEREGPPHACRFKSKVMLDGKTYESLEYFSTLKDAENAAAKVALTAVSSDGVEEEDPSFFKNLLQELAQKEYSCLPAYNTTWSGASHMPKFISTVEINEESFRGQEAKTKKLAEVNAAKVAYAALKERLDKKNSEPYFPGSHFEDTLDSSPKLQSTTVAELVPEPNMGSGTDQKVTESECKPDISTNADQNICGHASSFSTPPVESPCQPDLSENSEPSAGTDASRKKVKVYPRTTNMTFPSGTTIMHKDEKWVAVTTTTDSIHGNA